MITVFLGLLYKSVSNVFWVILYKKKSILSLISLRRSLHEGEVNSRRWISRRCEISCLCLQKYKVFTWN